MIHTNIKTPVLYIFFIFIAILTNVACQDISFYLYNGDYGITLSILVGTAAGLICKYLLDKKYIFCFSPKSISHDTYTFMLYTGMGVITTIIFWGFEYTFDFFYGTKHMRYTGAVTGLIIGYFIKYHLDKHFVFDHAIYHPGKKRTTFDAVSSLDAQKVSSSVKSHLALLSDSTDVPGPRRIHHTGH